MSLILGAQASTVVIWSALAPFGPLLFASRRTALTWFVLFLLVIGAIGMTIGDTVSIRSAGTLFEPGNPEKWAPWIMAAVLFYVAVKRVQHGLVLPAPLCCRRPVLLRGALVS